jgi:pimeloyl-ACP methyl ester carboxylesterase
MTTRRAATTPSPPPPYHRGGEGEPVVLLHGGTGTWRYWSPVIPLLGSECDVLALTMAGHWGGPPLPADREASVYALADAAARQMDEVGLETAHLVGASLGAWVALELAKLGRARTVVAISPAGGWGRRSLGLLLVVWSYRFFVRCARFMARNPGLWSSRARLRRVLYWHHFARAERMPSAYCADMILGVAGCEGLASGARWARRHGGIRDLERVDCPVRLVFPEKDYVVPKHRSGRRFIEGLPDAEVVDLGGVGHVPVTDDPELVARTVLEFVAPHTSGRIRRDRQVALR